MNKTVFVLTEYEYGSYSYSGIDEQRSHIHANRASAELHAKKLGLVIVRYCNDAERECTIREEELLDFPDVL